MERRTGGIVAAVTLTIAVAFVAVMMIFLNESVDIATRYAASETDLYATEVDTRVASFMRRQSAIASSDLFDDKIVDSLAKLGGKAAPQEVSAALVPTLAQMVVDGEDSRTFALPVGSDELYLSDGTWFPFGTGEGEDAWVSSVSVRAGRRADFAQALDDTYLLRPLDDASKEGGVEWHAFSGRPLMSGGKVVAIVGACVPASRLAQVMASVGDTEGQEALCFSSEGAVICSTDEQDAVGTDVFARYPALAGVQAGLQQDASYVEKRWVGLDGPMPRDQELFEVRYCEEFGVFLLVRNTAQGIFDVMRQRDTTIILVLTVVMVLLLLLVMGIVRLYRSRLIQVMTTDELTGLANRKSFVTSYERLAEQGDLAEATLALIDVDLFKQVNDTYGHAMGDCVLASVAAEVRAMAGTDGLAGRWGGDEFIGVVRAPAGEAVERIRGMVSRVKELVPGEGVHVSVSAGAAAIDPSLPLERMVEKSDDALYVTKEGGRGFLSVYEEGVTPHINYRAGRQGSGGAATTAAPEAPETAQATEEDRAVVATARTQRFVDLVTRSLLHAVRHMVPFVAGGGILIAIAFLIDGASVDMNSLSAEARTGFGSITPIAGGLHDVGAAAFNFMLPIFAAFFARELAGDEAFMAGFAGGYLASQGSAGFLGAICAAAVAAVVVRLMRGFMEDTHPAIRRVAPVLLYPVFSLLIMYLLMTFVIEPFAAAFDALLVSMLGALERTSHIALGFVSGVMMATDMGGPINKAAYHFGTASIGQGSPDVMASVMVGGMVPPCGIALAMWLFRDRFYEEERNQAAATLFMGLSFITEGALPFVLTDPLRVIPACMLGSGVAGALSQIFGCTLMAPHGGIFVVPVVSEAPLYLVALALGSLVTAGMLELLKKPTPRT